MTIKDYTFVTKQIPLRSGVPTVIVIRKCGSLNAMISGSSICFMASPQESIALG